MSKVTKEKLNEETKRIADQANTFYFEPVHIFLAVIIVGLAVYGGLKVAGVI